MSSLLRAWGTEIAPRFEELKHEGGQGLVEYALILVLVSIVSIVILAALGFKVSGVFNQVVTAI